MLCDPESVTAYVVLKESYYLTLSSKNDDSLLNFARICHS